MSRRWFAAELESVAVLWRLERRDGIALGLAGHDRDLWCAGFRYRAAPGMVLSAIEADGAIDAGEMDVAGALSHDLISEADLDAGRWDAARLLTGLVDWTAPDAGIDWLFVGSLGMVERTEGRFTATLAGGKAVLAAPFVPFAAPSCRAEFCGPGCTLSRARFEARLTVSAVTPGGIGFAELDGAAAPLFSDGALRWLSGANAGLEAEILDGQDGVLRLSGRLAAPIAPGDRAIAIQGCDRTIATCADRFGNAANFQGEPYLPGNDLLTRYPAG